MRVLKMLIILVLGFGFVGCSRWPAIYVGDSSGIITYDRLSHRLEIMWEHHTSLKDAPTDSIKTSMKQ